MVVRSYCGSFLYSRLFFLAEVVLVAVEGMNIVVDRIVAVVGASL